MSAISNTLPHPIDMNTLIRPLRDLCGLRQEQFAAKLGDCSNGQPLGELSNSTPATESSADRNESI